MEIDARGLKCPLPVLRLEKALDGLPDGARLIVRADDPVAKIDIPLYCAQHGLSCEPGNEGETLRFAIVKAGAL
jgi:tRNA 2-thiouridine synthesizing protein A